MNPVRLLDRTWLLLDGEETPMHVGLMLVLSPPPGAGSDYVQQLAAAVEGQTRLASPWNLILPTQKLRSLAPFWVQEQFVGMRHHLQRHELGEDGSRSALDALVAGLHAEALDPERPLWEFHLVEGLSSGQFVLYAKVHHALMDGVGGLRLLDRLLTAEPLDYWETRRSLRRGRTVRKLRRAASSPVQYARETAKTTLRYFRAMVSQRTDKPPAYHAPQSLLNASSITARRSFAGMRCDRARLKAISRTTGASDNEVLLAIFSGALKRSLEQQNALPEKSLVAALPVSTRSRRDNGTGTAISFSMARLGTNVDDPMHRLGVIQASNHRAKRHLAEVPQGGVLPYTAFLMAPFVRQQLWGRRPARHPLFNLVISSVPGPRATKYLGRARLDEAYPLSVLFHGQALNITCVRYADAVYVGFTACPDVLPQVDELARFAEEAFVELEEASRSLADSNAKGAVANGASKRIA